MCVLWKRKSWIICSFLVRESRDVGVPLKELKFGVLMRDLRGHSLILLGKYYVLVCPGLSDPEEAVARDSGGQRS